MAKTLARSPTPSSRNLAHPHPTLDYPCTISITQQHSQHSEQPLASEPYQKEECLTFYDDTISRSRYLRVVETLEGEPLEGFTLSCCMIVEDFTPSGLPSTDLCGSK